MRVERHQRLLLYSRIEAAADASLVGVDAPSDLRADESFELVLVDWAARAPGGRMRCANGPLLAWSCSAPHRP